MAGRNHHLRRRFALWALGQALPESDALKKHIEVALVGMVVAVAGGVLLALAIATAIAALCLYVTNQGYSTTIVFSVVAISFIIPAVIAFWLANSMMYQSVNLRHSVSLFGKKEKDEVRDLINQIIHSFLEGLVAQKEDTAEATTQNK